jgi:hypothetical protein
MRCDECKFWDKMEADELEPGEYSSVCRRYPPTIHMKHLPCDRQPHVWDTDWCGEFRPEKNYVP